MSGDPVPSQVDLRSQSSRALRVGQVRGLNIFDDSPLTLHTAYEGANMVEAGAAWSEIVQVRGYNFLVLMLEFTSGQIGAAGGFDLQVQCALTAQGPWFDRHSSFDLYYGQPSAALAGKVELSSSNHLLAYRGGSANLAIDTRCVGHFMRFRPLAVLAGADALTNSRFKITGIRQMESV